MPGRSLLHYYCNHLKRVWENFETKILSEYCNLYVQSDTLLLVDVSGNLQNEYLKISNPNPIQDEGDQKADFQF